MKKFGEIKSKILSKLVESYSSKNENEIKSILKILKEDKNFKEMYLFYEQIENMEFSNPESIQVYVEMVEPMLIEKSESIQKICKKLNEHVGEVDYEKNEIYECLDTLSEKSSISNLDKKITARKKLIEHLKKEKKQEVVETKIPHTTNQKLLATILSNNFNMIYESKMSNDDKIKFKEIMSLKTEDIVNNVNQIKEDVLNKIEKLLTESKDNDLHNKLNNVREQVISTNPSRYSYYKLIELKNGLD